MKSEIQSWKNPDVLETTHNPVSTPDTETMVNITGGKQQQVYSEDYRDPQLEALIKALSNIRFKI